MSSRGFGCRRARTHRDPVQAAVGAGVTGGGAGVDSTGGGGGGGGGGGASGCPHPPQNCAASSFVRPQAAQVLTVHAPRTVRRSARGDQVNLGPAWIGEAMLALPAAS